MSKSHGKFVWYDAMTSDLKAAETFYKAVIGWNMADAGMPDRKYTLLSAGPVMVGGLMPIPAGVEAKPCWFGYIAVDDVDNYAARVVKAGGAIHREPTDIPNVGRFAMAADPHGAVFTLFKPNTMEQPAPVAPGTPGHIGWHELHAGHMESDFGFYAQLFGWTKTEAIDMGPMGTYQLFATGGAAVGGMMTKMPQMPHPFWLYYFNVDAVGAAMERVAKAGGKLVMGPQEVPGGMWIAQFVDPQGAMFAVVSNHK